MKNDMDMRKDVNLSSMYLVLIVLAIYIIYSPAVYIPFYHHDIYAVMSPSLIGAEGFHFSDLFRHFNWLWDDRARPFMHFFGSLNTAYGNTFETIGRVRWFGIVAIGICCASFALWLRRSQSFSIITSTAISIMIFCLAGIQTAVVMSAWFILAAVFLGFLAFLCIDAAQPTVSVRSVLLILAGILCFFLSMFTYPAVSGFYLVPAAVRVLFSKREDWSVTRNQVIRDVFIFLSCSALYFLIAMKIQALAHTELGSAYQFNINLKFIERLKPLFLVFPSMWETDYSFGFQTVLVYVLLLTASFVVCFKNRPWSTMHEFHRASQPAIALIVLFGAGSSAYLLQPEPYVFARILFVFQAMSVLVMVWAVKVVCSQYARKSGFSYYALVGMTVAAAFSANYSIIKTALNDNMELNYIAYHLIDHLDQPNKIERIHLIGGYYESGTNFTGLKYRDDIFNVNSTVYRQDTVYILNAALMKMSKPSISLLYNCALDEITLQHTSEAECMRHVPKGSIVVTYSRAGDKIHHTPNMLVIDVTKNKLYTPSNPMKLPTL